MVNKHIARVGVGLRTWLAGVNWNFRNSLLGNLGVQFYFMIYHLHPNLILIQSFVTRAHASLIHKYFLSKKNNHSHKAFVTLRASDFTENAKLRIRQLGGRVV